MGPAVESLFVFSGQISIMFLFVQHVGKTMLVSAEASAALQNDAPNFLTQRFSCNNFVVFHWLLAVVQWVAACDAALPASLTPVPQRPWGPTAPLLQ